MKFGKLLKSWAEEEMPNQSDLFLRFKELKKQLKLIKPPDSGTSLTTTRPLNLMFSGPTVT